MVDELNISSENLSNGGCTQFENKIALRALNVRSQTNLFALFVFIACKIIIHFLGRQIKLVPIEHSVNNSWTLKIEMNTFEFP